MTEAQILVCKTCLNRKKGDFAPNDICNIRGHVLEPDTSCKYYDKDTTVVLDVSEQKLLLRPNAQRAKLAMIMLGVILLLDVVSGFSSYLQLELLNDFKDGFYVPEDDIAANDTREQLIGLVYLIAIVVSAVFFIQWFRRAYYNLQVRTGSCVHTNGWAAGGWFVPIISLFRPFQIMKEMDNKTSQMIAKLSGKEVTTNGVLIGFWWTLWIISNYIGNYVLKMAFKEETLDNYITSTSIEMLNSFLGVPLAVLAYLVVHNYAEKEGELVELEAR